MVKSRAKPDKIKNRGRIMSLHTGTRPRMLCPENLQAGPGRSSPQRKMGGQWPVAVRAGIGVHGGSYAVLVYFYNFLKS